jgi:selenocysteine-specific elongation factor
LAQGTPADVLYEAALALNASPIRDINAHSRLESAGAESALNELVNSGRLIALEEGIATINSDLLVIASPHWNSLLDKVLQILESYHRTYPLRRGMPREELKSRLQLSLRVFNAVIKKLITQDFLTDHSAFLAKPGHKITFDHGQQNKIRALMRKFEQNPFSPPSVKDCQAEIGEDTLMALVELDELIIVSSDVVFRKQDYDRIVMKVRDVLIQNGKITLAEVRDLFNTSRKYAQALLEHLDVIGVTTRDGDFRKLSR